MNKIKKYVFISIFILNFFILVQVYITNKKSKEYWYTKEEFNSYREYNVLSKSENSNIVNYIKINGNFCMYDDYENYYLCTVNDITNYKYNIEIISADNVSYISAFSDNNYDCIDIYVYNKEYYYLSKIYLTKLPILNVNTNYNIKNKYDEYRIFNSKIEIKTQVIDNEIFVDDELIYMSLVSPNYNNTRTNYITSYATMRYRGHDSLNYDKKSFKLNLKKYDNKKLVNNNQNLLGMRNDNSWILDAMYVDYSKIRNKLSSDLWKKISNANILNSQFVELFIDDRYYGLYNLKEPIDKKALNLSDDGALYKSILYLNYNESNYSIIDNKYFVRKYPNNLNKSSTLLYNKIFDYYHYLKDNTISNDKLIKNMFDLNTLLNYQVFVTLIKGVDNVEFNNYYYSIANSSNNIKIVKTPWDMDLTFGLSFNRVYDYDKYAELGVEVFFDNAPEINQLIIERYWELRKDVITMDTINNYLDSYKELLVSSGAAKRDSDRWYYYDIEQEIEKIRTWANNRITFLDEYFKI